MTIGGYVKRGVENNEPISIVCTDTDPLLEKRGLRYCAVFAGRSGSVCSTYLYEHLQSHLVSAIEAANSLDNMEGVFAEAFRSCDERFNAKYAHDASGSCAIVAFINRHSIHIGWTGECRAVLCCGSDIKPLSWEHHPTEPTERKRILECGGLITGGQIMGVLSTSRGFGDNDVKAHIKDGVFSAEPSVATFMIDEQIASSKVCFLILASQTVFSVFSNEAACKIVAKALVRYDNNPAMAAKKLAQATERKSQKECAVSIILWCDTNAQRSRSSSATSWRSFRSGSILEIDESLHF